MVKISRQIFRVVSTQLEFRAGSPPRGAVRLTLNDLRAIRPLDSHGLWTHFLTLTMLRTISKVGLNALLHKDIRTSN